MSFPKWISVFFVCLCCLALSVGTVSAADEVITLTSSTVVDGDENLSVHPVIELQFSGKVDDITVVSQNKDKFHLQDASGSVLPLQVLFPDVQVQNRFENHVFLVPQTELAPGAAYTLTVDAGLSDKKSRLSQQSYQMTFTTGTDEVYARAGENEDLQSLGSDILTYETALAPAAVSTESTSPAAEAAVTESGSSSQTLLRIAIAALILLLLGVGYWNWRSSRRSSTDA